MAYLGSIPATIYGLTSLPGDWSLCSELHSLPLSTAGYGPQIKNNSHNLQQIFVFLYNILHIKFGLWYWKESHLEMVRTTHAFFWFLFLHLGNIPWNINHAIILVSVFSFQLLTALTFSEAYDSLTLQFYGIISIHFMRALFIRFTFAFYKWFALFC